jgi:hypothetical protein
MVDEALDMAAEAVRFRTHAAQAFALLRDPGHACSSAGFLLLGTDWRITVYRLRGEMDRPCNGAADGPGPAFVWLARHDTTEEELDGGDDAEFDAPEAAWHAAVEALTRRLLRHFQLPRPLAVALS